MKKLHSFITNLLVRTGFKDPSRFERTLFYRGQWLLKIPDKTVWRPSWQCANIMSLWTVRPVVRSSVMGSWNKEKSYCFQAPWVTVALGSLGTAVEGQRQNRSKSQGLLCNKFRNQDNSSCGKWSEWYTKIQRDCLSHFLLLHGTFPPSLCCLLDIERHKR